MTDHRVGDITATFIASRWHSGWLSQMFEILS
jgi:hypothetical protein